MSDTSVPKGLGELILDVMHAFHCTLTDVCVALNAHSVLNEVIYHLDHINDAVKNDSKVEFVLRVCATSLTRHTSHFYFFEPQRNLVDDLTKHELTKLALMVSNQTSQGPVRGSILGVEHLKGQL